MNKFNLLHMAYSKKDYFQLSGKSNFIQIINCVLHV